MQLDNRLTASCLRCYSLALRQVHDINITKQKEGISYEHNFIAFEER